MTEAPETGAQVIDLMEALRRSLAEDKKLAPRKGAAAAPARRRARSEMAALARERVGSVRAVTRDLRPMAANVKVYKGALIAATAGFYVRALARGEPGRECRRIFPRDVAHRIGHAGQHAAFGFFFGREAGPSHLVTHLTRHQGADAGAASACAAGAGPAQAALLDRVEQGPVFPRVKVRFARSDAALHKRDVGGHGAVGRLCAQAARQNLPVCACGLERADLGVRI